MMDLFRKHKKIIYWVIILIVGVPFIFITTDYVPFADRARRALQSDEFGPVATVGDAPILGEELRRQLDRQIPPNPDGKPTDYKPLVESGQVDKVLTDLIKMRLMQREAQKVDLALSPDVLKEALKKDPSFKNEQGQFDPQLWNDFVRDGKERNMDWNAVYESVANGVRYNVAIQRVLASARVRDGELRDQFEQQNTRVTLKYLPLEPKVEPTEEQIKAHYEANKAKYDIPAKRKAEFAAVSLEPGRPEVLDELVAQAREGKDFTEIAKSAPAGLNVQAQPGSNWTSVGDAMPEQSVIFYMQEGQVSDPIRTPMGYIVYRVEETRLNPETAQWEVRASTLMAMPTLSDTERAARDEKIRTVAKTAQDGDLAAAATQAGLPVQSTDLFAMDSSQVQNVPQEDTTAFVQALSNLEQGKVSEVIRGQKNLYVAKVTELVPAQPQPLEAVRDRVVQDTVAEIKRGPDYKAKVEQLAKEIPQKVQSLDEVGTAFPELSGQVKEVGPFSAATYTFSEGPFWNPQDVVEQTVKAGEGKIIGPVNDMLGGKYLVQLVSKTVPDDNAWKEEFPKEKDKLRKTLLARRQNERFEDYLDYLLLRGDVNVTRNEAAIKRALNLGQPAEGEAGGAEAATAPAGPAPEAATPPPAPVEAVPPATAPAPPAP